MKDTSEEPVDKVGERRRTQRIQLPQRGISRRQAANLRARLSVFAKDWNQPEMDIYDAD